MEIISKAEARSKGFNKYFTGKPCKHGHIANRNMSGICAECHNLRSSEWSKNNREKSRENGRVYYKNNKEKCRINCDRWNKENPEKVLENNRKRNGQPDATRTCPDNCEICGKLETKKHKSGKLYELSLDHNHETGVFRGWLCSGCNMALGKLGDNKESIQKVLDYLNKI
jgi:hypothetical protein